VIPVLIHPGVRVAVAWLTNAFGFAGARADPRGPPLHAPHALAGIVDGKV